jgi:2-polyprenyl-6-methoxyphenol hydroxylase-like FAD-dependent oxidoreductase
LKQYTYQSETRDLIMNIVCLGGGPAGLYFGLLMKLRQPEHHITVLERNKPYDTFGWGVVFSDATMLRLQVADPRHRIRNFGRVQSLG